MTTRATDPICRASTSEPSIVYSLMIRGVPVDKSTSISRGPKNGAAGVAPPAEADPLELEPTVPDPDGPDPDGPDPDGPDPDGPDPDGPDPDGPDPAAPTPIRRPS